VSQVEDIYEWIAVNECDWYEIRNISGIWIIRSQLLEEWKNCFPAEEKCRFDKGVSDCVAGEANPEPDDIIKIGSIFHRHDDNGYLFY
jgi:hypothetical protein